MTASPGRSLADIRSHVLASLRVSGEIEEDKKVAPVNIENKPALECGELDYDACKKHTVTGIGCRLGYSGKCSGRLLPVEHRARTLYEDAPDNAKILVRLLVAAAIKLKPPGREVGDQAQFVGEIANAYVSTYIHLTVYALSYCYEGKIDQIFFDDALALIRELTDPYTGIEAAKENFFKNDFNFRRYFGQFTSDDYYFSLDIEAGGASGAGGAAGGAGAVPGSGLALVAEYIYGLSVDPRVLEKALTKCDTVTIAEAALAVKIEALAKSDKAIERMEAEIRKCREVRRANAAAEAAQLADDVGVTNAQEAERLRKQAAQLDEKAMQAQEKRDQKLREVNDQKEAEAVYAKKAAKLEACLVRLEETRIEIADYDRKLAHNRNRIATLKTTIDRTCPPRQG